MTAGKLLRSELLQATRRILKYAEYALMNPPGEQARDKLVIAIGILLERFDELDRHLHERATRLAALRDTSGR